jgi:hypothetical protein
MSIETWIAVTIMTSIIAMGVVGALLLRRRQRKGKAGA